MPYINSGQQPYYTFAADCQPRLCLTPSSSVVKNINGCFKVLGLCKNALKVQIKTKDLALLIEPNHLSMLLKIDNETTQSLQVRFNRWQRDPNSNTSASIWAEVLDQDKTEFLWDLIDRLFLHSEIKNTKINPKKLPKIPARGQYTEAALKNRVKFLQQQTEVNLEQISKHSFELAHLAGNVESVLGSVEIPLGVAGPLWVKGKYINDLVYLPMATTEGALVASAIRGATTVSRSGGTHVRVLSQRMMRVPLFILDSLTSALFCAKWLCNHIHELRAETKKYSNYAQLLAVEPEVYGKSVHVRFVYETQDAAGQNMTTTCTWHACLWVLEQLKNTAHCQVENFFIEANNSSDKKISARSLIDGRGLKVVAECHLPFTLIRRFLKVDAEQLVKSYQGFVSGSIASGMMGVNLNTANMLAALFTACGQDIASVHEASVSYLQLELMPDKKTVYASMLLPNLVIGTVGGGTALPHQQQCLRLLGCAGENKVHRFAEIIASACLALELSTLAAIASDQFALSHEKLGRNRPVNFLKRKHLNPAFFQSGLQTYFKNDQLNILQATPLHVSSIGSSIITELTSHRINKLVGLLPFELHYQHNPHDMCKQTLKVMVKVKPLDQEVLVMLGGLAAQCDPELAQAYQQFQQQTSLVACHKKELAVMTQTDPRFTKYIPTIFASYANSQREAYVLVEEYLDHREMVLMDSVNDISAWTRQHHEAALAGIADIHSIWLNRTEHLQQEAWIGVYPSQQHRLAMLPLWQALGRNAANDEEVITWFGQQDLKHYENLLASMADWWTSLDAMPKTLIHNDFNPRNITFRHSGLSTSGLRLCAYDWELATIHVPQYDLAEFLSFTLLPDVSLNTVEHYIEYHRLALERASGISLDAKQWREGYRFSLYDFLINRLSMYFMAHLFRHYNFMPRVYKTCRHLINLEEEKIFN